MIGSDLVFTLPVFVLAALATTFAGISKGGFGSGAAFASSAILALVLPPSMAIGIMLPLLMMMDVAALKAYWRLWSIDEARLLILGAIPGVGLGTALIFVANEDVFRILIGVVSLGFVAWRLWPAPAERKPAPRWTGAIAGVTAGFTSFVSHAGGPPAAIYLLSRGLGKTTYQATTVLTFWVINLFKVPPYIMLDMFSWQTLASGVWLAPFALIGTWIGVKAHHMISERLFFSLTYAMLTCTGVKLIWDALI